MNPFIETDKKNPFLSESDEDKSPPRLPPRPNSFNRLISEVTAPSNENTAVPPLPNRPSMARLSSFASEPNLKAERQLYHIPSVDRLVALSIKEPVNHPNNTKSTRNLPKSTAHILHKGSVRCWALSSNCVVTAASNIRSFNIHTGGNTKTIVMGELKPSSVAFVPIMPFQEEDLLWVGCEKGEILEISLGVGRIMSKRLLHSSCVTHILRFKAKYLMTLDEQGAVKIWTETDSKGILNLQARPRGLRIHSRLGQIVATVIILF